MENIETITIRIIPEALNKLGKGKYLLLFKDEFGLSVIITTPINISSIDSFNYKLYKR